MKLLRDPFLLVGLFFTAAGCAVLYFISVYCTTEQDAIIVYTLVPVFAYFVAIGISFLVTWLLIYPLYGRF